MKPENRQLLRKIQDEIDENLFYDISFLEEKDERVAILAAYPGESRGRMWCSTVLSKDVFFDPYFDLNKYVRMTLKEIYVGLLFSEATKNQADL